MYTYERIRETEWRTDALDSSNKLEPSEFQLNEKQFQSCQIKVEIPHDDYELYEYVWTYVLVQPLERAKWQIWSGFL